MVGLLPHPLRLSSTLLVTSSAAVVADRMVMAGNEMLVSAERRNDGGECRSFDAKRERMGALLGVGEGSPGCF